jgi:hypothetical protein
MRALERFAPLAGVLFLLLVVPFLWFQGVLRSVLAAAEGPPARLANTAWAGAILIAVGVTLLSGLTFAAADSVDDVSPEVTHTLSVLQADLFFPVAVGTAVFLLATGLAIVRSGALPAWLGWAALVFGVAALTPTPAAFLAVILMLIWIAVVSVMLFMRAASPPPAGPVAPQAPPQL